MILIIRRKKLSDKNIDLDGIKNLNRVRKIERNTLKKAIEENMKDSTLEKSASMLLEEVTEEMCEKYCRYPRMYSTEDWDEVQEVLCNKCPLGKLL